MINLRREINYNKKEIPLDKEKLIDTCGKINDKCNSHGSYCNICIRRSNGTVYDFDNLNMGKDPPEGKYLLLRTCSALGYTCKAEYKCETCIRTCIRSTCSNPNPSITDPDNYTPSLVKN